MAPKPSNHDKWSITLLALKLLFPQNLLLLNVYTVFKINSKGEIKPQKTHFILQLNLATIAFKTTKCWPENGTLDWQILTELECNGKWSKTPYALDFWDLRSHPSLCHLVVSHQIFLLHKKPSKLSSSPTEAINPLNKSL